MRDLHDDLRVDPRMTRFPRAAAAAVALVLVASSFSLLAAGPLAGPAAAARKPGVSIGNVTVAERDKGRTKAVFTLTLSARSSTPVTVKFKTANGSAVAPKDFSAKHGKVTFPANRVTKRIRVNVKGDKVVEGTETFTVKLSQPVGATIKDGSGRGTVRNDDKPSSDLAVLTVTRSGAGTGSVASSPTGISCPSDCSQVYVKGTKVTLTPTATGGGSFSGWSGACSGTGSCVVTMSSNRTVGAGFSATPPTPHALNVDVTGETGALPPLSTEYARGSVTSNPTGISCNVVTPASSAGDCSEAYPGTTVTLTAAPSLSLIMTLGIPTTGAMSTFTGWGGACAPRGTNLTCTVTLDQVRNVTAAFGLPA